MGVWVMWRLGWVVMSEYTWGVVDGSHGDGGLRRNIPDSGCERWCFRIVDRVSCVGRVVGVLVWICVWSYIRGVSFRMSVCVMSVV